MRGSVVGGKLLAGKVNSDGTVSECVGGELRCIRTALGRYTIYFPPGFFSAPPVVTGTAESASGQVTFNVTSGTVTAQKADVRTQTGSDVDSAFNVTIVGRG